mgnify:CR=1 FL=1
METYFENGIATGCLIKNIKDLSLGHLLGFLDNDLIISINNKPLKAGASRGEVRTTLLAIKLAESYVIENIIGTKPILLLDDVYGELDDNRQNNLVFAIKGSQVLVTTNKNNKGIPVDNSINLSNCTN